jgi:hypothetical protein
VVWQKAGYDAFLEQLETLGYRPDVDGMVVDLALADDFLAAAVVSIRELETDRPTIHA